MEFLLVRFSLVAAGLAAVLPVGCAPSRSACLAAWALPVADTGLALLQINHPLDCPICDQGGECDLQDQVRLRPVQAPPHHASAAERPPACSPWSLAATGAASQK